MLQKSCTIICIVAKCRISLQCNQSNIAQTLKYIKVMQNQSTVKINRLPDMAIVEGSIFGDSSNHNTQGTKKYQTSKLICITRYQREYEIEYAYVQGELQIWAVDGNTDVEDTYSDEFIKFMECRIEELSAENKDNDDEYDDWFQNGE